MVRLQGDMRALEGSVTWEAYERERRAFDNSRTGGMKCVTSIAGG